MRPFNDYPTSFGSSRASIWGTPGPAVYVQVVIPTPPAPTPSVGGQVVEAVNFGFKFLDFVTGGVTDSGRFFVEAIPVTPTVGANESASGPTYRLRWISRVTASVGGEAQVAGTEATADTNLTGETVRLFALGPK